MTVAARARATRLRDALFAADPLARRSPEAVALVRAPGRVNLIGEHTDYNDGFVLPAAIGLETWIAFRRTGERAVELTSLASGETRGIALDGLVPPPRERGREWIDYVAATAWALGEAGIPIRGFRGVVDTNIPIGAGLSSSAALELAATYALVDPDAEAPPAARLALLAQRGENAYVGVRCGIMDQFASALGQPGHALLVDCRSLEHRAVPLPAELQLVVCDTRVPRRLDRSEYNARRAECEEGARLLRAHAPTVRSLRDVDLATLERFRATLPPQIARRCEHVVRENGRVHQAVLALERGDLEALGRLFDESHRSLRDLYEVSSPELDALVEIARSVDGVVAARMTGAGFGGCTVNLVRRGAAEVLRDAVLRDYPRRTGREPAVHVVVAVEGAGRVVDVSEDLR